MDLPRFGGGSMRPSTTSSSTWYETHSSSSSANTYQLGSEKTSEEWSIYRGDASEYDSCGRCGQIGSCSCAESSGSAARNDAGQMNRTLPNVYSNPPRYWEEGYQATQFSENDVEGQLYDETERLEGYSQNGYDIAAQDVASQQYSNTSRVLDTSQVALSPTWDSSSSGIVAFNSTDSSSFRGSYEDHDMVDEPNDYDFEQSVDEPEQQVPAMKLSDLEVCYQPCKCLLNGCRGDYVFETFRSFLSHINNVHSKAMWCGVPGCPHSRPFGNKTDLQRHHRAKHGDKSDKPFKCTRENCPARVKAFIRKDKLQLHNKQYHAEYRCYFCPRWFNSSDACFEHTNNEHIVTSNS